MCIFGINFYRRHGLLLFQLACNPQSLEPYSHCLLSASLLHVLLLSWNVGKKLPCGHRPCNDPVSHVTVQTSSRRIDNWNLYYLHLPSSTFLFQRNVDLTISYNSLGMYIYKCINLLQFITRKIFFFLAAQCIVGVENIGLESHPVQSITANGLCPHFLEARFRRADLNLV